MTHASRSPLISIALDRSSSISLQAQIFDQIKHAILAGRLKPGTRLSATRVLAKELGVSRNTVLAAFDLLIAEDYIAGQPGSGTRVTNALPQDLLSTRKLAGKAAKSTILAGKQSRLSTHLSGTGSQNRHHPFGLRAFRPGLPDLENFPFQLWSRMIGRFWRHPPGDLLLSGDMAGYLPLREVIAQYLAAVRGVQCSAEQVLITSGAQQALDLIARTIIDPGDKVWVEDPGYAGMNSALLSAGAQITHIPLDNEGISVDEGLKQAANAVLAAVTPSHQYPLGITMSLKRRLELLEWASKANAWILEDDFDSEFRYGGKPLSALQGLDQTGRVIYVGTFSKVLFPSLRLGYVVVPESLLGATIGVRRAVDDHPSLALQPALYGFIAEGHFASHIRRLRKLYAERQEILIDALAGQAEGLLFAEPHDAGMHLVANLNPATGLVDKVASHRASKAGLVAPALSDYCSNASRPDALLLGYAGLSEKEINRDVKRLVIALS